MAFISQHLFPFALRLNSTYMPISSFVYTVDCIQRFQNSTFSFNMLYYCGALHKCSYYSDSERDSPARHDISTKGADITATFIITQHKYGRSRHMLTSWGPYSSVTLCETKTRKKRTNPVKKNSSFGELYKWKEKQRKKKRQGVREQPSDFVLRRGVEREKGHSQ